MSPQNGLCSRQPRFYYNDTFVTRSILIIYSYTHLRCSQRPVSELTLVGRQLACRNQATRDTSSELELTLLDMPLSIDGPRGAIVVDVQPLCQQAFASFGTVVENPAPGVIPGANLRHIPKGAVQANQGSALKYHDVTDLLDFYPSAPSTAASRAVMNMFVCAPRLLQPSHDGSDRAYFPVEILERHPFTTQTFIPLGLSAGGEEGSQYLVIVAPSLGPSPNDVQLPVPDAAAAAQGRLPGRGLPDLMNIKAFIATGSQAVTYGAGTWHAPMAVVGKHPVPFVVAQFTNGVDIEDCQEVVWGTKPDAPIRVSVPKIDGSSLVRSSKL